MGDTVHVHKVGFCPVCDGENLTYGSRRTNGDQIGYEWTCEDCGTSGVEWFALTFIEHIYEEIE